MDQGGQVVGVGLFEAAVIGIEPLHRPLQRAPGVEAAGSWGTVDVLFGFAGCCVEVGPVGFQEREVGHYASGVADMTFLRA